MKIGIITDIHYGRDGYFGTELRRIFRHTDEFLADFVRKMNTGVRPDIVVQLGDLIEDTDSKSDRESLERVGAHFAKLESPVVHVLGNHDRPRLSAADFEEVLGHDCLAPRKTIGGIDLCFLESELDETVPFFTERSLSLLQSYGQNNERPVLFFSHHPLAQYSVEGNRNWSPGNVHKAFPSNRAQACSITENIPGLIACVNGHLHANYNRTHGKNSFFTVQSLVDNFRNDGTPAGVYAVLEIGPNETTLEVFGNDPAKFSLHRGFENAFDASGRETLKAV